MIADRFSMTVAALMGEPWPKPAPLPGRVHVARDEPLTDAERDELLRDEGAPDAEAARVLGLSRQRIGVLRRGLRAGADACQPGDAA